MPSKLNEEIYDKTIDYVAQYADLHEDMRTWVEFRHGKQWKSSDESDLKSIGHAPITVDYIDPCIEHLCSYLTANNPKFSAVGRMDSDTKTLEEAHRFILEQNYIQVLHIH